MLAGDLQNEASDHISLSLVFEGAGLFKGIPERSRRPGSASSGRQPRRFRGDFPGCRHPSFRATARHGVCAGADARGITGRPDAEDGGRGRG